VASLKANYRLDTLLNLVGLARSTYYYHLKKIREHYDKHARLKQEIFRLFHEHHKVYGCRRIRLALLNRGWVVSLGAYPDAVYGAAVRDQTQEIPVLPGSGRKDRRECS